MAAKEVRFSDDARQRMFKGVNVLANAVYAQKLEEGRASAFAVIMFILVLPIIIYNVRQMRLQKEIR